MKDHILAQPFQMFRPNPREWELFWYLSRDTGDSSDVIIPHRSRFYNGVVAYLIEKKKKPKLKNISLINGLKLKL